MTTPINGPVELLQRLQEGLPHNTLFGRMDALPKEFKEGWVVSLGDVNKDDDSSGLCCNSYERVIYIDYRAQLHRDGWMMRTLESQEELLGFVTQLHPRLRFQNFDEPQVEGGDSEYVMSRSTWVFQYDA